MVYRWLSRGWLALGVLLVLLAVLVSLIRVAGPLLNEHRQTLIAALFADRQLKVTVGELGLEWTNVGPSLVLQQLEIAPDSKRFSVQLGKVLVHLDFWRSLNELRPVFGRLLLHDGDIAIDLSQASSADPQDDQQQALLSFLLTQLTSFDIHDTRLRLTTALGEVRALDIAQLRWQNRGKRHQGVGKAYLINGLGQSTLDLIVEVSAPSDRLDRLKGSLYLAARELDITPLLARTHSGDPKVSGQLDLQLWSEFTNGQLWNTLLTFGRNTVTWQGLQDGEPHRLSLDGGTVQLRREGDNWQFASHGVALVFDGQPWLRSHLQLERREGRIIGYLPALDLGQIAKLSQLVSGIYPQWTQMLKQVKPAGQLQDLVLQADGDWQGLSLQGRLNRIKLHGWQDVPGVDDLNGEFWLTPTGGSVRLALAQDRIDLGRHFKQIIPVEQLSARLDWWREGQGWVVYGQDIALDNQDLRLASRFRLELFEHPFLALTGRIDVKNAGHADRYFPLQAMDKGLVDYLSGAIKGGKATGADLLWYGEFKDFPYDQGEGMFQVAVPLEQATYQFFPGWQPLTDLQIDLLFQNASLDMRSRSSKLGKARSDSVHAWIPAFAAPAHLYVDATVAGEGKAISDYLQDSPLASSVGQALREVEVRGPLQGRVKLDIPLNGRDEVQASGEAIFRNNRVRIASLDLPLDQVSGRLEYDNQQTRFHQLTARLWDQPLTIDYQGRQHPDRYQVDLDFNGQWDTRRQLPAISALGVLAGRSDWQGKLGLTLPNEQPFSFALSLDSSLQGMGLDLPAPLTKPQASTLPLLISAQGGAGRSEIRASLGAEVGLYSQLSYGEGDPYLNRVQLEVGRPSEQQRRDVPMLVVINQPQADVADWLARLTQWLPPQRDVAEPATGERPLLPTEWWVDGQLARADIGSAILNAVRFTVAPVKQATEVMIDSPDVMGVIRLPQQAKRPIDAKFARIHWSGKGAELSPAPDVTQDNAIMAAIPWLTFSCVDCRFGQLPLGEVKGELLPGANKLSLKGLEMRLAGSQLTGSVDWLANGSQMETHARGKLTSNNSELLLKRLGYTSPIGDAPGSFAFDLNWQDVPYRPSLPTLGGSANYQLEAGTLREVNDKGARLLSLLSLDSLLRKLRLDFRDVFDKGFYFESMSASATIKQGQVSNDDFYMKGAAGNLRGEGMADLVRWQLDYQLRFSPNLGGTLPVVAAFSITPVTGLYVLALSKLLEPVVDVITRIDFRVSGPIDAPKLVEAGRDRARIKLNQQQKKAVDAVAPSLPKQETTPFLLKPLTPDQPVH
ncbi:YhdP family protein [Aeromonas cavernicola]|uniref:TIGR02099 family protein n=1 Tax=Aeromonas cavernicola TaxID=1006623 RepID=A0A2H9U2B0_9GAMM|nr:YhdP family protein [Aeromonas cavernicola]PJG58144.1 TIGR02099 family protein [Aeromonas cavernicola]